MNEHGNQLLKILSEKETKTRYLKLRRFANTVFNRDEMSRLAMGKYWKDLSASERNALKEVLFDYFVVTYGSMEMNFQGISFKILETVKTGKDVLLKTKVDFSNKDKAAVDQIRKTVSSDGDDKNENENKNQDFIILFALRAGDQGYYIRDAKFEGQSIIMFVRKQLESEYRSVSYDTEDFLNKIRKKVNSRYRAAEDLAKRAAEKGKGF